MVLEFESLATVRTLEATKDGGLIIGDHVALGMVELGDNFVLVL